MNATTAASPVARGPGSELGNEANPEWPPGHPYPRKTTEAGRKLHPASSLLNRRRSSLRLGEISEDTHAGPAFYAAGAGRTLYQVRPEPVIRTAPGLISYMRSFDRRARALTLGLAGLRPGT